MGLESHRKSAQHVQRASSLPPAPRSGDARPRVFKGVSFKDCLDSTKKESFDM